jgi:hypothetical protein
MQALCARRQMGQMGRFIGVLSRHLFVQQQAAMVQKYFTHILYITGIATMLPLLQYFLPELVLSMSAILIFCIGALLVYAARHPVHRRPAVWAALVEKLGFCSLILMGWNNPALQGLHLVVIFDLLCVMLYGVYLWGTAGKA